MSHSDKDYAAVVEGGSYRKIWREPLKVTCAGVYLC